MINIITNKLRTIGNFSVFKPKIHGLYLREVIIQEQVIMDQVSQRKMLVLVNGNKFKIGKQQHYSPSNCVSANSLIAKFIRYDAFSITSL